MSMANIYHELLNGVALAAATSVPRGILRVETAKATTAMIMVGVVSGAISVLCTDVNKYMPGGIMFDTSASVSNDVEVNLASSVTASPVWAAISNA